MTGVYPVPFNDVADVIGPRRDPSEPEFHEIRKGAIGASDVSTILQTEDARISAFELWHEKTTGERSEERQEPSEDSFWGRRLEPVIADVFGERTGICVEQSVGTLARRDTPWMICNPDGLVPGVPQWGTAEWRAGVECKNVNAHRAQHWADDNVSPHALCQSLYSIHVSGLERWHVVGLVGGSKLRHVTVERDDDLIGRIVERVRDFHQLIETNTPPPLDDSRAAHRFIRRLYATAEPGKTIELPVGAYDWLRQLVDGSRAKAFAEQQIREAQTWLAEHLKDAELGTVDGVPVVSYKSYDRKGHTRVIEPSTVRTMRPLIGD